MSEIAILEVFTDLPEPRRTAGQRHQKALCLALFTLAIGCSWLMMVVTPYPKDFIGFSGEYSKTNRLRRAFRHRTPEALIYRLAEGSYPLFASCILLGRGVCQAYIRLINIISLIFFYLKAFKHLFQIVKKTIQNL